MPTPIEFKPGNIVELLENLEKLNIYQTASQIPAFEGSYVRTLVAAEYRETHLENPFHFLPIPVNHYATQHGVWALQNIDMITTVLGIELNSYEAYLLMEATLTHDADNLKSGSKGTVLELRDIWTRRKKEVTPESSAEFALKEYGKCLPRKNAGQQISRQEIKSDLDFLIRYHTVRQSNQIPDEKRQRGDYEVRLDLLASILLFADSLQRTTYRNNREWIAQIETLLPDCEDQEVSEFYALSKEVIGNSPLEGGTIAVGRQKRYFELWKKLKDKDYAKANPNSAYVARLLMSAYMSAVKDVNLEVKDKEIGLLVTTTIDYDKPEFMKTFVTDEFASKVPEKADKANAVFARYDLPQIKMEDNKVAYTLVKP